MRAALIIILFGLMFVFVLQAQVKVHKHITAKDGLVQGQAMVIREDSSGYLWIGTYGGVSRWDGKNFMNLTTLNGLTASQVMDIEVSPDGTVYMAPYGGGIISYKDGIIDTINESKGLSTNWISEIHILKNGDVLFGGYQGNISLLKNDSLLSWIDPTELNGKSIWEIYESKDGSFYIGTYHGGFFHIKDKKVTNFSSKDGLLNDNVWSFHENNDSSMFIGTNGGLHKFKNGRIESVFHREIKITASIYRILDYNKTLYFASSDGLYIKQDNQIELITSENGLSINELWSLYLDKNGFVFLGTNGNGFHIYKPNLIENFSTLNWLPANNVWVITADSVNNKFIGTDNGLLIKSGNTSKIISTAEGLTGNNIRSIKIGSNKDIYIGTRTGLNILTKNSIKKVTVDDGLIDNQIFAIEESFNNEIYIATREGVSLLSNNSIKNITEIDGLVGNYVQTILSASDSTIYFGTYGSGVTYYKNGIYKHITKENGLVDEKVQTLAEGDFDEIYIGTYEGGMNIWDGTKIKVIDIEDGLSSNSIQSIAVGKNNQVYVTTLESINIIDLNNGGIPRIRIINSEDGLASDDCNRESTYLDKDGILWVGTKNGLTKYNPKYDLPITTPPAIYITELDVFNKPYDLKINSEHLSLNYDQNYLKFYYTGINLSSPDKMIFRYKLTNIDKDWVESNNTAVQYTSLDDGKYTFEVKAKNEWGYWSEPAKLTFTINPAWWETWWFYLIAFSAITSLIAFLASYHYRHLLALEKVRTKISEDLHDNIGSGLAEITFLSEMVKSHVKENEKANKGLNNITGISKTLIDDMRDIVWLVNPNNDTLKDLFNRLQDSYQEVLKFSEISLAVNGIDKLSKVRLPMSYRQHIFLMFKEAINNSLKYSECKNIIINVNTDAQILRVDLSDDGKGFDIENANMGNGVNNIKKRAKMINGNVSINSEIGKGTSISFSGKFSKLGIIEV